MPKMKTHSGSKKRFKVTAKGKVKSRKAFTSHMMTNKPKSMKRKARGTAVLDEAEQKTILSHFLPYSRKKKKNKPAAKKAEGGQ